MVGVNNQLPNQHSSRILNLEPKINGSCASASLPAKRKNFARALARLWLPYESVTMRRRSTAGDWQMPRHLGKGCRRGNYIYTYTQ